MEAVARRLKSGKIVARKNDARIEIDGCAIPALAGESIAAAMAAAGLIQFGRHHVGTPRSLGCGMGACLACQVDIKGFGRVRACMTPVADGMQIATSESNAARIGPTDLAAFAVCDVAIVGAGPAGLSAARILAGAGLTVSVVDERPAAGGQYFKPLAPSHMFVGPPSDAQFACGIELVDAVRKAGADIISGATVWNVASDPDLGFRLNYERGGSVGEIGAKKVLIATGAIERPWIVPGWTLPGAMTTGAAQTLARSYRVSPGTRIVVCGNGPLNFQLAAELAASGAHVVAVVEAAAPPFHSPRAAAAMAFRHPGLVRDGLGYLATLRRYNVQVIYSHVLVRIEGDRHAAAAAVLRPLERDGSIRTDTETRIDADCVTMGYGFQSVGDLAQLLGCSSERSGSDLEVLLDGAGRSTLAGVYLAGDCTRPRGALMAIADGEIAATSILADMGLSGTTPKLRNSARRRQRETSFQDALWKLFAAPLPRIAAFADPQTIVCRCEGLRLADVSPALASRSVAAVKRSTRCGMGLCQGRYCIPTVIELLRAESESEQPLKVQMPIRPVAIATLAGLPEPLPLVSSAPLSASVPLGKISAEYKESIRCDTAIVGGGVIGLCAAFELARTGEDLVLVEGHSHTGAEASGANAGSLHVQSLAYAFDDFDTKAAKRAFQMLPLQRDSVRLWQDLAVNTMSEFELSVAGGLCLAHGDADMGRLREKVEREKRAGISVDILSGTEAKAIVPSLADEVVGASYSPDEGKLNPLLAIPRLTELAVSAGARMVVGDPVADVARDGRRFRLTVGNRTIDTGRLVLTAGVGIMSLAAKLGTSLTVVGTPLQMSVTERVNWPLSMLISHVTDRLTMKQTASGNLIIGGGWRVGAAANGRPNIDPRRLAANLRAAKRAIPATGSAQILRTWTATNAMPPAGPLVGALPGVPGCYLAVSLNGLTLGPVLGSIIADLVRGRDAHWDIAPFDPSRL